MNITIDTVTKRYKTVTAVDAISLNVQSGQIYALLGPNGAGKSSLVRMLVGLTEPDSGTITISDNEGAAVDLQPGHFAYLPEDRGLYQDRTILDNLTYVAKLRGLDKSVYQPRIDDWLEHFELTDRKSEPMRQLSKGNQQKVQLISTLLHDPDLVILDEPFSGLDPVNQEHVLNVLSDLKAKGKTVLLSAHQMALVERLADKMLLMSHGKALAQGTLEQIRDALQPERLYRVSCDAMSAQTAWADFDAIEHLLPISADQVELTIKPEVDVSELWPQLAARCAIESFAARKPGLHELYLDTIGRSKGQSQGDANEHV
ncbi:ATP-binding cassette domain-containing protein [Idiomarina sp.]|jgi:ABC-2 type transport system ATP-binding protein|uniref:ABC transporter ATP-binding protein n=1 Tax=Idiomarina sp. TaxID=1874361 RepID=UPI000C956114|nr:ATP-binding cassette domain-containing protein [Idiomarina sp.]MAK71272.1 Na+ ABC transporter ATP-binding protein [Idiomarinaceae bacterium]HAD49735.1 Na+ ABC transporter ATP-binding protein [Idiomarina sp.]